MLTILFVGISTAWYGYTEKEAESNKYVESYAEAVASQLEDLRSEIANVDKIRKLYNLYEGSTSLDNESIAQLEKISNEWYELLIFENDGLVFWTDNHFNFKASKLLSGKEQAEGIRKLNGQPCYLIKERMIIEDIPLTILGILPLDITKENIHQKNHDLLSKIQVDALHFSKSAPGYAIKDKAGKTLFYLSSFKSIQPRSNQLVFLLLIFLSILSFFTTVHHILNAVNYHYGEAASIGALTMCIALYRLASLQFDVLQQYFDLFVFDPYNQMSFFGNSLFDQCTFTLILFWATLYFHKNYSFDWINKLDDKKKYAFAVANYGMISSSLLFGTLFIKNLILQSGIYFDFENIFNLNKYSFIALGEIVLLLLSLFIFTHKLASLNLKSQLSSRDRFLSLLVSGVGIPFIFWLCTPAIPLTQFFLAAFIYIILLDVFIENNQPNVTWLITWLTVIAALSSSLMYTYNNSKELQNRKNIAGAIYQEWLQVDKEKKQSFQERIDSYSGEKGMPKQIDGVYDIAIYENEERMYSQGALFPANLSKEVLPAKNAFLFEENKNNGTLFFRGAQDELILVGKKQTSLIKPVSLFSYLFSLMGILILIFSLTNGSYDFLPEEFRLSLYKKPSLKNKIQLSVILLIIFSFFIIGLVTIIYIKNSYQESDVKRTQEKTYAVLADLHEKIGFIEYEDIANNILTQELESMSQIHQSSLNLYNTAGHLIKSTSSIEPENRIPTLALHLLKNDPGRIISLKEQSSTKIGPSSYLPILGRSKKLMAYLSVDSNRGKASLNGKVSGFMGTLLNAYVFLFLIAGALAITVADSITKPLGVLGEKLKKIKLGRRNEALNWNNEDEIGTLIRDYNLMIEQLADSAQMLAMTERDSAWREMAKQVAHEIKNPLTPMKLSIQHLQMATKRDPQNAEAIIQRISSTLIEQIDNLSSIASEFSNFAKMPKASNEKIILNEVVSSAHDLFRKREDMDINLYVPMDEIFVFADRNHLMRVLTNLLKNATQAIPEDRKGVITISVKLKNNYAQISVKDNGIGIPDDMKERVFYPNFTTKNSGTGLGLAISSNLVESFNGNIFFETEIGKGTEFFVEIPLLQKTASEEDQLARVSL